MMTTLNGSFARNLEEDIDMRLNETLEVAFLMDFPVIYGYSGAPTVPGMIIQLAASEQYYLVARGGKIELIKEGPALTALLVRDLRIHVELHDYAHDPPEQWIHRHNGGDQTFFIVDISNENHERAFRNIKKPFFVMRIHVFDAPDAAPEPHFVAFILKGVYYYIYGGKEGTQVYKLHKNQIVSTLFDTERRGTFLQTIGGIWDHARYCIEGDFAGYGVVFLPKVIPKNPYDMYVGQQVEK